MRQEEVLHNVCSKELAAFFLAAVLVGGGLGEYVTVSNPLVFLLNLVQCTSHSRSCLNLWFSSLCSLPNLLCQAV